MKRENQLEYARNEQERIVQFLASYWHNIVLVGFVLLIVFTIVPVRFIEHSEDPLENWQKFGYWATHFYALSAFATLIVVLGAAILAMRQLTYMDRTQKLQVALRLFDEFKEIEDRLATRNLYENFCSERRFKLVIGKDDRKDITYILHTYAQIGAMVHESPTEQEFIVPLLAGVCVRMWIILEEHIREERDRRRYPFLYAMFEYLVILCLRFVLDHEPREVVIYHPDHPDDLNARILYTTCCLLMKLRELELEVKDLRLHIPESRIYIPSEMAKCPYPVCKSPFLDIYTPLTFPYRGFSKCGC